MCRCTYHLLLHLAYNTRTVGPLSMVAQRSMEIFPGVMNRKRHATSRFSQSVSDNNKLEASVCSCGLQYSSNMPHINVEVEEEEELHKNVFSSSPISIYSLVRFRHPRREIAISGFKTVFAIDLESHLLSFYEREGYAAADAISLLFENPDVVLWDRMEDKKTMSGRDFIYRSSLSRNVRDSDRPFWFMAAALTSSPGKVEMSCGKVFCFFEHKIGDTTRMLYAGSSVSDGLHRGGQGEVFAKLRRNSPNMFRITTVESIETISHLIMCIEAFVPWKNNRNRKSSRTYFIDELRLPYGMMGNTLWRPDYPQMSLVRFRRHN